MTTAIPSWLSRTLNFVGVAIVAYSILTQRGYVIGWELVLVAASLVGWAVSALLGRRAPFAVLAAGVAAGALATTHTDGIALTPVLVIVISATGPLSRPLWQGISLALLGALLVPVGLLFSSIGPIGLAAVEAGLVLATFGGLGRRQARYAEERERNLLREQARGAALAERQAVARDIHDVLAHSLGGLVLQLDAIDAQLEAGHVTDAAARVTQARALAADGLAEARRAVDALRDDSSTIVPAATVDSSLAELVDAHRALGGRIDLTIAGKPHDLPDSQADALRRALQEALTNARKHAAGTPVRASIDWNDGVELVVSNPVAEPVEASVEAPVEAPTSGHGLRGMAERFDGFGAVSAAAIDGRFVVTARVRA